MGNNPLRTPIPGEQNVGQPKGPQSRLDLVSSLTKRGGIFREGTLHRVLDRQRVKRSQKKPLRIMKFGGTSVGDASSIAKVVEIIKTMADANAIEWGKVELEE